MKSRQLLLIAFAFIVTVLVTGCWDRMEIEERGTILGLAIDPVVDAHHIANVTGKNAKSDIQGYRLTAQIAIPGRISLGPTQGGGAGPEQKPVWVISTSGKTIDDAMNNLQQELADKVFLGHLRVIIVNKKLAESIGMNDIQDFFRRNAEIRRLAWLLISTGAAKDAMEAAPKLERVPTLYLVGTMDHAVDMGKIPNVFLGSFWSTYSANGQEPVLPLISVGVHGIKDRIKMDGLAVFKQDRCVGELSPIETGLYLELKNVHRPGYALAVPAPNDPAHSVMVRATNRICELRLQMIEGKPVFDAYTRLDCNIEEKTGRNNIFTPEALQNITNTVSYDLVQRQEKTLRKLKQLDSDVIGFGEYIRGYAPEYWEGHIRTRQNWEKQFPSLTVRFHVQVNIRRVGMSSV